MFNNNDKLRSSLNPGPGESQSQISVNTDFGISQTRKSVHTNSGKAQTRMAVNTNNESEKINMFSSERLLLGIEKLLIYNQERNLILLERQNKIDEEEKHKNKMKKFPLLVKNLIILNNVKKSFEGIKSEKYNENDENEDMSSNIDDQPNSPGIPTPNPANQKNTSSNTSIPSWESYINRRTPLCSSEQATLERKSSISMKIADENKKFVDIDNYDNDNENKNNLNDDINTNSNNDNIADEESGENNNTIHKNPIRHILYLRNLKIKQTIENSQVIFNPRRGLDRGKPLLFLSEVKDMHFCMCVCI